MKKVLLVIIVLCVAVGAFFFWRLSRPGFSAFPRRVDGIRRTSGPEYRNTETYQNVYAAVYGEDTLHVIQPTSSAEEAKSRVQKFRESLTRQQEQFSNTPDYVTFSRLDQPQNNLLVFRYKSGEKWTVAWAHDNWFCTVDSTVLSSGGEGDEESAQNAVDFAASLPYGPAGVTPSSPERYSDSFSIPIFIQRDLPVLFTYWLPVLIPTSIAFIALIVLLLSLFLGQRKRQAVAGMP